MSPRVSGDRQSEREVENPRFDMILGRKLQLRRMLLGLSQAEVAASLSISAQQVAQLERGEARMFASHLYILSRTLGVPVGFFFEDVQTQIVPLKHEPVVEFAEAFRIAETTSGMKIDGKTRREVRLLVRAFQRIPPGKMRTNLLRTVRHLAR